MMRIGLMIEGQDGLTWERWRRLLQAAEDLGFAHVFRSDHFTNPEPPDTASLELWTSLTYAAGHTARIEFGPLVTPVTFRHPAITARMAAAVDDLSGGRLTLGIGAGWQEREHRLFGVPFPPVEVRYGMLQEYLEVVARLLRSDQPVSYQGQQYALDQAILLPRPQRPGGPPILVGGNGPRRTLPIAARYADEWNAVHVNPTRLGELNQRLDGLLDQAGRPRNALRRSAMLAARFARDEQALAVLEGQFAERGTTTEEVSRCGLVGTPTMWVDQLRAYADAGADRVMLQWIDQDNIADLEVIARDVLPAFEE